MQIQQEEEQSKKYERQCHYHEKENIIYLQIGKIKQKQIGACSQCFIKNELNGKNLILVSDVQNLSDQTKQILVSFPKLDKQLLSEYQSEYESKEYIDVQNIVANLKNKIGNSIENLEKSILSQAEKNCVYKSELLKKYDQISNKGQFITLFKEYMIDNQVDDNDLSKFISNINQNQQENEKQLRQQLEIFKKFQQQMKQQQPIQQILIDNILKGIQMLGKTFTFDNNNSNYIQSIQQDIIDQLQAFNKIFKHLGKNQQEFQARNQLYELISQNSQNISIEFSKFAQNIFQSEIEIKKNAKEIIEQQQQQQTLLKLKFTDFQQKIDHFTSQYCNQLYNNYKQDQPVKIKPGIFGLQNTLPINNYKIRCPNPEKTFTLLQQQEILSDKKYRVQLAFIPFQNKEGQYNFCIGFLKNIFQDDNMTINSQVSYCLSNNNSMSTINTKAVQGMHISDQKIAHSEQMRRVEFVFCLSKNQLQFYDIPDRQNITEANDERLEKIGNNNKYFYFQTQGIEQINIIEFKIVESC
ncbi:hypothetical protein ABPG74_007832 [Tetrahymena malaccensis]